MRNISVVLVLTAVFGLAKMGVAQTPNVYIDSLATVENVTLTDSSIAVYGKFGVNINPLTSNQVGRCFCETSDGNRSDTLYHQGATQAFSLHISGLQEAQPLDIRCIGQRVDTTGGQDLVIVQTETFYMQGSTMWSHAQPVITNVSLLDATQTSLTLRVSLDAHAGSWVRLKYYNVANGFTTAQWSNDSIYAAGPNAIADVVINGLVPGQQFWTQAYANDWQIGEGTAYAPGVYTTDSPDSVHATMAIGGTNPDSVEVCLTAISNDVGGSYILMYGSSVLASGPFTDSIQACQWVNVGTPNTEATFDLTVTNSIGSEQFTVTGSTSNAPSPSMSIISIDSTGWYTGQIVVATSCYGGTGGMIYVYVPGLAQTFGPFAVTQGSDTTTISITGPSPNNSYLCQITLVQTGQQNLTVNGTLVMPNIAGPTISYTQTVGSTLYTVCINGTTADPAGATATVTVWQGQNTASPLLDTTFAYTGETCFQMDVLSSTNYSVSVSVQDTIGTQGTGGGFTTPVPAPSPDMDMSNATVDQISGMVSIPFWANPMAPSGTARCLIGTSAGSMISPVDTVFVTSFGNYEFIFDASGYQQVGQPVIIYFTMDMSNQLGGYAQWGSNNFFTLNPLPDTTGSGGGGQDSVVVSNFQVQVVSHNMASVSWDIDPMEVENVELYFHYGIFTPTENTDGPLAVSISDEYWFVMEDLEPHTTYRVKLVVMVDGSVNQTSAVHQFTTESAPAGIEEVLVSQQAVGRVYTLTGQQLGSSTYKRIFETGHFEPNQVLIWVSEEGQAKKFFSK